MKASEANSQKTAIVVGATGSPDELSLQPSPRMTGRSTNHRGFTCRLSERAADVFDGTAVAEPPVDLKVLHAKIKQLTLENDFLESAFNKVGLLSAKR